jgi:hypothetical protein
VLDTTVGVPLITPLDPDIDTPVGKSGLTANTVAPPAGDTVGVTGVITEFFVNDKLLLAYDTAICSTIIVTVLVTDPPVFVAVTVIVTDDDTALGVPLKRPVLLSILKPAGNVPV